MTSPGARRGGDPLVPGILAGIGLAGTLDEVVLHQLLRWHHFYTGAGEGSGEVSDGLFHLASTLLLVLGAVLLARRRTRDRRRAVGAVLAGTGGFNLYDGTVQHKLLRLHQVREGAGDQLPYDVGFLAVAAAVFAVGVLLVRGRRRP